MSETTLRLLMALVVVGWATAGVCVLVWQLRVWKVQKLARRPIAEAREDVAYQSAMQSLQRVHPALLRVSMVAVALAAIPMVAIMILNN